MKVVFITHYTALYGANRSLLNLIDGLKEYNVESFVLCPAEGEITIALEKRSISYYIFPFKSWMSSPIKISKKMPFTFIRLKYHIINVLISLKIIQFRKLVINLIALPFLVRQSKRWNVDIIYTNSSVIPIGALIAFMLRKPHIWHIREFGKLDYQLYYDWGRKVFEKWLNKADAVIAISNAVKRIVLENVNTKTYIIYNGVVSRVECNAMREKISESKKSSNYIFAIVGSLIANKGQEQAIRVLAYLRKDYPNIRLLVVGSGNEEYLEALKKLCNELEVTDLVEFWGYIPNPFEAYLKADAILMCSKYEAMGRVTAEAMSAAKPVIGYNNGGTSEIIENEVTGLLYNDEYKGLAHCMARFIENPEWAKQLGINGWKKAKKEFTIEVCAKQIHEALQEVTKK